MQVSSSLVVKYIESAIIPSFESTPCSHVETIKELEIKITNFSYLVQIAHCLWQRDVGVFAESHALKWSGDPHGFGYKHIVTR